MTNKLLVERGCEKIEMDILFTEEQIKTRIKELGKQISCDYKGKELLVVGVLKGSFVFMADLVRAIDTPLSINFIGASSYVGTKSSGYIRINHDLTTNIKDRHVLLVEDIVDTGETIDYLCEVFKLRGPASLKICSFLTKPEVRDMRTRLDYIGFEIPKEFVVGYGLDYNEQFRELPFLTKVLKISK